MRIKCLYTEPATIEPVCFHSGVNIILGEGDTTSSKNNGVGKSLCIEFINFALLKRKSDSRLSKIPVEKFDHSTLICLDFDLGGMDYTIKRSLQEAERPVIFVDGREIPFSKTEDAVSYLTSILSNHYETQLSFREILGPLIRDERSEFKSIVSCFDTKARIPDNYAPHLMMLGIDVEPYRNIKYIQKELDDISAEEKRIKDNLKTVQQKKLSDARSELNALESEVEKIGEAIDALRSIPAYDMIKNEIFEVEDEMAALRRRRDILTHRSANLAPIASDFDMDTNDVRVFYNQLRDGLGSSIVRDLNEVIKFKSKITRFQKHLLDEKSNILEQEIKDINKKLVDLDTRYRKLALILDQNGELRNLRQTYAAYQSKLDELGQLKGFLARYDQLSADRQSKKFEIESQRLKLQESISAAAGRLRSFEQTILDMHHFIQGNKRASFEVRTTTKKQVIEIVLRIDDDGSHSVEREKVFIYDISLMLNEATKFRHPGILIHDNIFEVDDDTLQNSLEFILTHARFGYDQQYILTINADRVQDYFQEAWGYDLEQSIVATFTKSKRFLKTRYQEKG